MKKILFVDDEPNVLAALRRMLRPMRNEWETVFTGSGQEALRILADGSYDVLVTDIRMPGMNGVQLLEEVKKHHPDVVRITLSGQSDDETILRTIQCTHQYLSKPCDAETLRGAVERAFALRELLADGPLKRVISQISSLPSVPALYLAILDEVRAGDASIQRIGRIIARDVSMTAKLLQLVNSAFFGLRSHIPSIQQAVSMLGLRMIKALVLSVQVFAQYDPNKVEGFQIEALMNHSVATGVLARTIATVEKQDQQMRDDAFLGGMLHDVGKLMLADNLPQQYAEVLASRPERSILLWEAEHETFGASHAEVGAYLMGLWGLPDSIVESLAFHHRPSGCVHRWFSPLTAVHVADAFEHEGRTYNGPVATIDEEYLEGLGVLGQLSAWREACYDFAGERDQG